MALMIRKRSSFKQIYFNLGVASFGLSLIAVGFRLLSAEWTGVGFVGGFLLMIGIQVLCWAVGIRLEILGNVTDDDLHVLPGSETAQVTSTVSQH